MNGLVNKMQELWLAESVIPPQREKCSAQAGLPGSLKPRAERPWLVRMVTPETLALILPRRCSSTSWCYLESDLESAPHTHSVHKWVLSWGHEARVLALYLLYTSCVLQPCLAAHWWENKPIDGTFSKLVMFGNILYRRRVGQWKERWETSPQTKGSSKTKDFIPSREWCTCWSPSRCSCCRCQVQHSETWPLSGAVRMRSPASVEYSFV